MGVSADAEVDLGDYGNYVASVLANEFGFNFGGGIDLKLFEKIVLNGQEKYMLHEYHE